MPWILTPRSLPPIPPTPRNLISVRSLARDNFVSVEFDPFGFSIKDLGTQEVILRCNSNGDLYLLCAPTSLNLHASSSTPADLWHQRLGHPGRDSLLKALASFPFTCNKTATHICSACQLGKHVRLPFYSSTTVSYFPFQLLHSDVWTSPIQSIFGNKYYLVLLDDYTHYTWTFPLRCKSEVLPTILAFHAYVSTQFQHPILALQTNNGHEFDNLALHTFFSNHSMALRLSRPYTS
jgi:hypothetical protein